MSTYRSNVFTDLLFKSGEHLRDVEFIKCTFSKCRCYVGEAATLTRCTIQNVHLLNCSQDRCLMEAPILQDSVIDGLNTKGQMLAIHGGVFCHVTLRGKIDRLRIRPDVTESSMQPPCRSARPPPFTERHRGRSLQSPTPPQPSCCTPAWKPYHS